MIIDRVIFKQEITVDKEINHNTAIVEFNDGFVHINSTNFRFTTDNLNEIINMMDIYSEIEVI